MWDDHAFPQVGVILDRRSPVIPFDHGDDATLSDEDGATQPDDEGTLPDTGSGVAALASFGALLIAGGALALKASARGRRDRVPARVN